MEDCCGSSAGSRPTSATRTRTACTSPPTTTTSRSCRASAIRGVRGRIDLFGDEAIPLYEDEARAAIERAARRRRRGDRRLPALQLPQLRARGPHRARSSAEVGARGAAGVPSRRALPDAPRLPAPELDADRGLRRRALARAARSASATAPRAPAPASTCASWPPTAARSRSTPTRAGAHADLRPDRRRDRRALPRRPARTAPTATSLCTDIGGTSFDIALITDGEFRSRQTPDIGALPAQPAAGPGRLDRRRHGLVRAHRPQLGPARARPRLGRRARSASCWPEGGLETPRSPTSTWSSAASTPTTSSAAT